jgi:hypothetical protein
MNASKERKYIKGVYPNPTWSKRVDSMTDDQVIAVYYRLKEAEPHFVEKKPDVHPDQGRLF